MAVIGQKEAPVQIRRGPHKGSAADTRQIAASARSLCLSRPAMPADDIVGVRTVPWQRQKMSDCRDGEDEISIIFESGTRIGPRRESRASRKYRTSAYRGPQRRSNRYYGCRLISVPLRKAACLRGSHTVAGGWGILSQHLCSDDRRDIRAAARSKHAILPARELVQRMV
jgi:hypothetical protein